MAGIVSGFVVTPEGEAALAGAVAEAKLHDSHLTVVHAIWRQSDEDVSEETELIESHLQRAADLMKAEGVSGETRLLVGSVPVVEVLVALAKELDSDLFFIGLPRRTRVGKLLLGSTAMDLLLQLDCPVVAVKAPHGDRF